MSYQKVYKGKTFTPGKKFPERCYFEGCTIQATCTFGEGCYFVDCTFQKCCPSQNNNPPSVIKAGIVENCTLESVTLDKETLGVNNKSTGYKVKDKSWSRDGIVRGDKESVCLCYLTEPNPCKGVSLASKENEPATPEPVETCKPCTPNRGYGDSPTNTPMYSDAAK